jgi:hypothetical protein
MNMITKALAATSLLAVAAPASAAVIVDGTSYGETQSFTIYFDGYGGDPSPSVVAGLTSNITFTVLDIDGATYKLGYLIDNTSIAPITNSRVANMGFNVDPNFKSATIDGVYSKVDSGNIPNFGKVEFCGTNTSSCAGGAGDGVFINTPSADSDGTITLNFDAAALAKAGGNITLDKFFVRYQSIAGAGRVTSAIGREITPPPAVPEPGTWAMMLFGFGAAGVAMRRSRRKLVSQLA